MVKCGTTLVVFNNMTVAQSFCVIIFLFRRLRFYISYTYTRVLQHHIFPSGTLVINPFCTG